MMTSLKKMLALVLVLSISIFAAGCGDDNSDTGSDAGEAAEPENAETGIEDIKGRFDEFEE